MQMSYGICDRLWSFLTYYGTYYGISLRFHKMSQKIPLEVINSIICQKIPYLESPYMESPRDKIRTSLLCSEVRIHFTDFVALSTKSVK